MMKFLRRTWAEIDLDALDGNISEIRRIADGKPIMAIVKANAYGHDTKIICDELARLGVTHFAVSSIWEANQLREILPDAEIVIFGYTDEEYFPDLVSGNIIQTAGSTEYAEKLSRYACENGVSFRVHVKINTGMTRVGVDSAEELDRITAMKGLSCEGAYTHFAAADSDDPDDIEYTKAQQKKLLDIAGKYRSPDFAVYSKNSGGIVCHREFESDFCRAGIIMYGCTPNTALSLPLNIKPVLTFKSAVCQLKSIPAGTYIGYGRAYKAERDMTVAVIPVGYADGYSRGFSGSGRVEINGRLVPICGRVCMDQTMLDVTDVDDIKVGDEVILYSADNTEISVDTLADNLGTIGYELLCAVGHRVPRVAVRNGEEVEVRRYI